MGKAEVREELYAILERGSEYAYEEVRPLSIVGPNFLPGNDVTKLLLRPLVDDKIEDIEVSVKNSLTLVMDYSEELARDGDADGKKYKRKFLKYDMHHNNYEGDRKKKLQKVLLSHFEKMAQDMVPLVRADTDDFWEAYARVYAKQEAEKMVENHFSFVGKVIREFSDELKMTFTVGPLTFDYTNEAIRVLPKIEERLRQELMEEIEEVYESESLQGGDETKTVVETGVGTETGTRNETEAGNERGTEKDTRSGTDTEAEMDTETDRKSKTRGDGARDAPEGEGSDEKVENLRRRVEELEKANERLREEKAELEDENEELRERLEETKSYSAEDWLG